MSLPASLRIAAAATLLTAAAYPQVSPAGGRTFEVASIKARQDDLAPFPVCGSQNGLRLEGGRFTATNTTLFSLVTWAYGIRYSCFIVNDEGLVSGGPKWVVSDRFDVQAVIPPGVPAYTAAQLQAGEAPEIQEMLRALVEDRFKLIVHRVTKEVPVYTLTVSPSGPKLAPARPEETKYVNIRLVPDENNEIVVNLVGNKASLDDFTHVIEPVTHTAVLNRTGLTGEYSFDVKFAVIEPFSGPLANLVGATGPSIFSVFDQQLGFKIARGSDDVEAWIIDRAEKPTEN